MTFCNQQFITDVNYKAVQMLVTLCYNLVHNRVPVWFLCSRPGGSTCSILRNYLFGEIGITYLEKTSCLHVIVHHVQNVFMINI